MQLNWSSRYFKSRKEFWKNWRGARLGDGWSAIWSSRERPKLCGWTAEWVILSDGNWGLPGPPLITHQRLRTQATPVALQRDLCLVLNWDRGVLVGRIESFREQYPVPPWPSARPSPGLSSSAQPTAALTRGHRGSVGPSFPVAQRIGTLQAHTPKLLPVVHRQAKGCD